METPRRMSTDEVEFLVVYLLRSAQVFGAARGLLTPAHFRDDRHLGTLWEVARDLIETRGHERLTQDGLRGAIRSHIESEVDTLSRRDIDQLLAGENGPLGAKMGFLPYAFEPAREAELDGAEGLALLERFLEERKDTGDREAVAVPVSRASGRAHAPDSTWDDRDGAEADPGDFSALVNPSRTVETFSTGCAIFDRSFGGQAGGEVYGFIAPIGAGKTTVGNQLAVATARVLARTAATGDEGLGHSYFFSYEDTLDRHALRSLYFAAEIDRDGLRGMTEDAMSRRGKLKTYETERYRRAGLTDLADLPGECERLDAARADLNRNFHLVDFNSPTAKGQGHRGVTEIASYLEREIKDHGRRPGMVVIDYCGKAVELECALFGGDLDRQFRGRVGAFPLQCRDLIARRFDVPVWINHQVRPGAIDQPANAELGDHDGAESRSFARDLNFLFAMAMPDPDHHIARLTVAKASRGRSGGTSQLVRLDGPLGRIEPADKEFMFDPPSGRFVRHLATAPSDVPGRRRPKRPTRRSWSL